MSRGTVLDAQEIERLRHDAYNASVVKRIDIHDELLVLRVRPDQGVPRFTPGQYSVLGLGNWEARLPGCQEEQLEGKDLRRVLKRAYSLSCSLWGEDDQLHAPHEFPYLEFYMVLVRERERQPPGLTPRLFALTTGSRLFVGPKATGHYTLQGVQPDNDVIFVSTGTGEAPHNAMVAQLLTSGHRGRIVTVTCVRRRRDLGYAQAHRRLEACFANYRYLALTTREPENLDPTRPGYVGRRYLQEYFACGAFEHDSGVPLDPRAAHVFLCGNPTMIGAPKKGDHGEWLYPQPVGMTEFLEQRGFHRDNPIAPGSIHFEKYW